MFIHRWINKNKTRNICFPYNDKYVKCDNSKLLGVIIHDSLSTTSKICITYFRIYLLYQKIACVVIHNHITYCILLWGNLSHAGKVFKLQKRLPFKIFKIMSYYCYNIYLCYIYMSKGNLAMHSSVHRYNTTQARSCTYLIPRYSFLHKTQLEYKNLWQVEVY